MIKCICDMCAEEVMQLNRVAKNEYATDAFGHPIVITKQHIYELCNKCHGRFKRSNLDIAEFMKLPIEDLQLYDCMFEVGDEVITDDGRVGVIESICDCEKCKKRGFYEPMVINREAGTYQIYISDTDKENGFRNFYKIGDNVYGNIDEDTLLYHINSTREEMRELTIRRRTLAKQMKVLEECKKEQEKSQ